MKLEIINISLEFVADFCVLEKKKVSTGTLRRKCWISQRIEQMVRFTARKILPFA